MCLRVRCGISRSHSAAQKCAVCFYLTGGEGGRAEAGQAVGENIGGQFLSLCLSQHGVGLAAHRIRDPGLDTRGKSVQTSFGDRGRGLPLQPDGRLREASAPRRGSSGGGEQGAAGW